MPDQRKQAIVRFKKQEQRPDKRGTIDIVTEIVRAVNTRSPRDLVPISIERGCTGVQKSRAEDVCFDLNTSEAPFVVLYLSDQERKELEENDNVESVIIDGGTVQGAAPREEVPLQEEAPALGQQRMEPGIVAIGAPAAWAVTKGRAVKVAVLDTGIDRTHSEFGNNYKDGVSFVSEEPDPMDEHGHGTHCAGVIAAEDNQQYVVGVAPEAHLYAVKVLNSANRGTWPDVILGIEWCIREGIEIASMSFSGLPDTQEMKDQLLDTLTRAWDAGMLLVAAAGNNGRKVEWPAILPSVIAVSAVNQSNQILSISSQGSEIELCAPGYKVWSTGPTQAGGAWRQSQTSAACPHVAGAAALAWSAHSTNPDGLPRNKYVRRLLAHTATRMPGQQTRTGQHGFGLVNAGRAVFHNGPVPPIPELPGE